MPRVRVLHLLSRFNIGGTERQLIERLRRHPPGFEPLVGCFEAWGPFLDLVCANAEAVRRVCLAEEGCRPERVALVRNGLDLALFDAQAARPPAALPVREGEFVVALVGNLWPVKGYRTLVEAAALLREAHPHLRFVCAGEGSERPYLERRIGELGLKGRVFLLGHRTDVPSLLSRVHALCLCSSAEGLPNAVMEAMAARLPVVATRVGGTPELVDDGVTGVLVRPGDPAELAIRLHDLITHPERARQMGLRGRAYVESELSLDRMAVAHDALYRRALSYAGVPSSSRARAT
jgi:L-malate glycosyltransferase